jgi:WD40 repeat protein
MFAADDDNKGWVWDLNGNRFHLGIDWPLGGNRNCGWPLALTSEGRTLAVPSEGGFQLWDLSVRSPRAGLKIKDEPDSDWSALAFAPNGKMPAAGGIDQTLRLIDLTGKKPKEWQNLKNDVGRPLALSFSPDGNTLAVGGYGDLDAPNGTSDTVPVYEVATGKMRWSYARRKTCACSLSFAPDGRTLAISWGDGVVSLIEAFSGKTRMAFQAVNANAFYGIAFSPHSKLLATAGDDWQVAVWAGSEKRWSVQLPGPVAAVAWAPDSRHLATANANGTVYILRVP